MTATNNDRNIKTNCQDDEGSKYSETPRKCRICQTDELLPDEVVCFYCYFDPANIDNPEIHYQKEIYSKTASKYLKTSHKVRICQDDEIRSKYVEVPRKCRICQAGDIQPDESTTVCENCYYDPANAPDPEDQEYGAECATCKKMFWYMGYEHDSVYMQGHADCDSCRAKYMPRVQCEICKEIIIYQLHEEDFTYQLGYPACLSCQIDKKS